MKEALEALGRELWLVNVFCAAWCLIAYFGAMHSLKQARRRAERAEVLVETATAERILARESTRVMMEEHRRMSAIVVSALANPKAKVTVVMSVQPTMTNVKSEQPQGDLS